MKRSLYILIILLIYPALGSAREAWRGFCEIGGAHVLTSGLSSSTTVQKSSVGCTVTVYITGGALATIYADNNGTPLANPFTADAVTGMWVFWAPNGRYTITTSSPNFSQPVIYTDVLLCDPADVGSACGTTVGSGVNIFVHHTLVGTEPGIDFIEGNGNVTFDPATDDPVQQRVHLSFNSVEQAALSGTYVGAEPMFNFIPGANISLTVADNVGVSPPRIDVTIAGTSTRGLVFTIGDPGGTALTAASTTTEYLTVPFACTIAAYNLAIDAGTITVKFWKIATGTAIPTVANVINTSGVGISSGTAIHSTTVSDFTTTAVAANDILAMNVTAVATAKYVNGVLACTQ